MPKVLWHSAETHTGSGMGRVVAQEDFTKEVFMLSTMGQGGVS